MANRRMMKKAGTATIIPDVALTSKAWQYKNKRCHSLQHHELSFIMAGIRHKDEKVDNILSLIDDMMNSII